MNRTTTYLASFFAGLALTSSSAWAAPLPGLEPSAPQQQAPTSPPAANEGTLKPGQNQSASPATTPPGTSATPSSPQGLTEAHNGIMDQDLLTGDWGGLRKQLEDDGMKLSPTYIGEVFGNPSGGARQGVIYDGLLNVALDLDLERMSDGGVDGLTLHANALYLHGTGLSARYVGDFSNTSNIAGYNSLRLQELWLQKWLWEKRLSIKVGNIAVDSEFFQSSSAALFLNGTFGAFTFIASNVSDVPVYPLASPGVRIQFLPTSSFYVMAGVFGMDLNSEPNTTNQNGTRFALDGSSGTLIMSEAGYLLNQSPNDRGLQGTYRVGSFVHTADYTTFDGNSGGTNYGVYGVMDQQIYTHDDSAISLFVRSGGAPSNIDFVDYYVEGGFNFSGFVPGRTSDVAGIAVARSHVSSEFSDAQVAAGGLPSTAETVIEATYKWQAAPWWSIQPDVQYIVTPSGVQGSKNATVLGLRTTLAF
jgi:porin